MLNATSTIVETPTVKQFVRIIGTVSEGNDIPLLTNVYPLLGDRPGWLWVKNIDPSFSIIVGIKNAAEIADNSNILEIAHLFPGETALIKVGKDTAAGGARSGYANYTIGSPDEAMFDAVVIAT